MDAVNSAVTAFFNLLLAPLELLGREFALVVASGVFGILALFVFKHISYQRGIKAAKDRIKGHLIEIRIYQDDLWIVARAIAKVMLRNLQYVGYNLLPFVPLAIPFVFVLAQFVTRYAFAPLPVQPADGRVLAGGGTVVAVELARGHEADVAGLTIEYPPFLRPLTAGPVRAPSEGRAFQEVIATAPGRGQIALALADGTRVTKDVAAGDDSPRMLQPERVRGFFTSWLWPAEKRLESGSPIVRVHFTYPDAELRWMPDGVFGVLLAFLIASIVFALAVMKPLKVQI